MIGNGVEVESGRLDRILVELNTRMSTPAITSMLGSVHEYLQQRARNMFAGEKDPWNERWAPLAESTIATRISHGYGSGPINVRTGQFKRSIVDAPPSILGHSDGVISLAFPSRSIPQGKLGQKYRQAAGYGKGPARQAVGMNEKDMAFIISTLNTSLFSQLGRAR